MGRALLRRFVAVAVERGAEQIFLEVRAGNAAAIALYAAEGFVPVARRTGYYPVPAADAPREDALVMRARFRCRGNRGPTLATRDDLLQELRLWPRWTLRPAAGGAPAPGESPVAAAPGADRERPAVAGDPGARATRIAALGWDGFAADVDACTACGLCRSGSCSVPGVGDVAAEWLFVGEAPGAEEDAQGEPFVGQAGRLLDSMLAALATRARRRRLHRERAEVPPARTTARRPRTRSAACRPYLDRQVALIAPGMIVALGKSAANTLLESDATIGSLRGRVHAYRNVPLVVTYHPAYLLRTCRTRPRRGTTCCSRAGHLRSGGGG